MSATTEPTAPVCGQSSPNADNLRTCSACQNDLVCHDLGECRRPTPETDAYKGTHETHRSGGKTIYGHAEQLERQRDEAREAYTQTSDYLAQVQRALRQARADRAAMREAIKEAQGLIQWLTNNSTGLLHRTASDALAKLQPFTAAAEPAKTEGGAA